MPIVEFFLDFERDLDYIKKSFPKLREKFGDYFDSMMKLYYPKCFKKTDMEILEYFKLNKEKIIEKMKLPSNKLKENWSIINNDFFNQTGHLTKFKWANEKYICYVSSSFIWGGYKKPNVISVFPLKNNSVTVLVHELIHLHILDILDKLNIKLDKQKLWNLSEIVVIFIISNLNLEGVEKEELHYSKLIEPYEKVKSLWKGNFKQFIFNSIEILKI